MRTNEHTPIREALIDNYNNYAEGIDSRNWDLVRACFADEVLIDFDPVNEVTGSSGSPWRADDWVVHLQGVINGFDVTRHTITNHRVQISGDEVCCRAYLVADHVVFDQRESPVVGDDDVVTVVGEYTNHYVQIGESWKICQWRLVVNYNRGNLALFDTAAERAAKSVG